MDCPRPERLSAASYVGSHGHPPSTIATVLCYLMLGWRPDTIARETFVGLINIYEWQNNLRRYGSVTKPHSFIN